VAGVDDEPVRGARRRWPAPAAGRSDTADQRAKHGGTVRRANRTIAFSPAWDWTAGDIFGPSRQVHGAGQPRVRKTLQARCTRLPATGLNHVDANSIGYGRIVWLRHG